MMFTKIAFRKILLFLMLSVLFPAACATATTNTPPIPTATSTPAPNPPVTRTQTPTPTMSPTPDIWQIQSCSKASNIVTLDNDWIWEYDGDIEGSGELDALLNFTANNEILGFVFDSGQAIEYKVNGCVQDRAFIIWLSRENIIESIIQGEIPATDPQKLFGSTDLNGEVLVGQLTPKYSTENYSVYLNLRSGTFGTMQNRFDLAGTKDDRIILDTVQKFLTAVANDDRTQVVELLQFPLEVSMPDNDLDEIETSETFLLLYDSVFGNGFKERLAVFPNYLRAYAGKFVGTIGMSVYDGGGVELNGFGKITGIYNWKKSDLLPEINDLFTPTPSPRFPASCGTVKLGQPGTQELNDWNAPGLLVHGTAILCTDYLIQNEDDRSNLEPIWQAMFDLDSGKPNIELADMIFEVYGRMGFYYISGTNGTRSETWTLEADENLNFMEPPQPTYDQCKEQYSDPLRTDNEPIYLCVITGEGHVSRVKIEKFNPIERTFSIEISFVTWKDDVLLQP